ncbi:MAG: RsiV family protein [Candidatus Paceibacterota bacterium]|jgi:hypothetical protein
MKRDTLIGVVAFIALLAGVVGYAALRPAPAKAPGAASSTSSSEHTAYYDIATNYASSTPLLTKVSASADAAAVALMKQFVADTVAQFKTDGNFDHFSAEDIKMMDGRKEKLQIVYLIASSPRTVSYIFTIYMDTLGAHGNTFFKTFTFDTTNGALLNLADLFTGAYLSTLSTLAREKLPAIIGEGADTAFIQGGTTPEDKNFANFFFDNQDIVFVFPPYAVAPYSSGPQTLYIPLSELTSILKLAYR